MCQKLYSTCEGFANTGPAALNALSLLYALMDSHSDVLSR